MDFKKVLDQTVRELKREVNKKVLKVPEIEQKVMDATSNEPWGPHGTVMADIAQATRNHYEYQMIMAVLWKRLSDTGRNWRHVYKALTVLEYLVAHGAERVIDDIKEHAYHISMLADFQYVEPNGKDQGINVRKKSQTLVALVNDKEKIREVRQKAVENRNKYRGVSSTGGMYKPSSYESTGGSYGGDRYGHYGSRDDDRYHRDRDVDRYREGDRCGGDWDHTGKESDRYRDDYNRDHDNDEDGYGPRRGRDREKSRSFEKDFDQAYDDDADRQPSRSDGGRDNQSNEDQKTTSHKPSAATMFSPPSYEEALQSPDYHAPEDQRALNSFGGQSESMSSMSKPSAANSTVDDFEDFNPRASSASAAASLQLNDLFSGTGGPMRGSQPPSDHASVEGDFFGDSSLSSFTLAPPLANMTCPQGLDSDVFGNSAFKVKTPAVSTASTTASATISAPTNFTPFSSDNGVAPAPPVGGISFNAFALPPPPPPTHKPRSLPFGDDFFGAGTFSGSVAAPVIAPPAAVSMPIPGAYQQIISGVYQANQIPTIASDQATLPGAHSMSFNTYTNPQQQTPTTASTQATLPGASKGQSRSFNTYTNPQQQQTKFETKSSVWADGLSKGLIDLNIAGPKSNPLSDIGIDFDLLRTERIKEERATSKSTTTGMGKAMGSGSGLGVAGASAIGPPAPAMMNSLGIASPMLREMGMGMAPQMMMQMNLNPGMATMPGMGMGLAPGSGMGMNAGTGGFQNQQQQYGGFR